MEDQRSFSATFSCKGAWDKNKERKVVFMVFENLIFNMNKNPNLWFDTIKWFEIPGFQFLSTYGNNDNRRHTAYGPWPKTYLYWDFLFTTFFCRLSDLIGLQNAELHSFSSLAFIERAIKSDLDIMLFSSVLNQIFYRFQFRMVVQIVGIFHRINLFTIQWYIWDS